MASIPIHILPAIAAALDDKQPLVALESTVISHGLPYPQNLETAQLMEKAVRDAGALPATIAILKGEVHVGLTAQQLTDFAQIPGRQICKCSRRDLPIVLGQRMDGGTTVAGTMIIAQLAGIELFATGGIGGVHRGHPFDVSADLVELGRTPVSVVCSGAKSILDLPATRELLETHGVTVIGFQTDEMPAFYSQHSGLPVDIRVDTVEEAAEIIMARGKLGLQNGSLIVVPPPADKALDADVAEAAIAQATAEAAERQIFGHQATPWLLTRVAELTEGKSLQANIALLANNCQVAAQIAAVVG